MSAANRGGGIAEEARVVAFRGRADSPEWLGDQGAQALFAVSPSANIVPEAQRQAVSQVLDSLESLRPHLDRYAASRANALLASHVGVRAAGRMTGKTRVEPRLPVDILGVYVFLPHVQ
jgi:hypothetical protein